jgi:hypothetical protein
MIILSYTHKCHQTVRPDRSSVSKINRASGGTLNSHRTIISLLHVGIYATGPFAHLFHGVVEESYIFHVMDYALCLTKSKQEICTKPPDRGGPVGPTSHSINVQFSAFLLIMTLVVSYVQS